MERADRERTRRNQRERLRRRLIVGGALIVIVNLGIAAVVSSDTSVPDEVTQPGVEAIIPADGANILPQAEVGIDLAANLFAEITFDGQALPNDEFEIADAGRGLYVYRPGTDQSFARWEEGNHTLRACFWDSTLPEPPEVPTCISWAIKVG